MTAPDRRSLLAAMAGGLLAGCAGIPAALTLPPVAFGGRAPLGLDVAAVEFTASDGGGAVTAPSRDMRFAMYELPGTVARRWSQERLEATGTTGVARVVLVENRFVAVPLETDDGIEGFFTDEQSVRYDGAMKLKIEIAGHPSGSGFVEARSTQSRTAAESLSLNERKEILHAMLADIVDALDRRLEAEIREHLWRWLTAP